MSEESTHPHSPPSAATLAWVSEHTDGSEILGTEVLTSDMSHSICAITLDRPGERRVVLRRWAQPGSQAQDPEFTIGREVAALILLEQAGFPAPRLLAVDPQGDRCGTPALLMTCLPGRAASQRTAPSPRFLEQLAATAVALHCIPGPWPGIPGYRPYNDLRDPRPPERSARPDLWERRSRW